MTETFIEEVTRRMGEPLHPALKPYLTEDGMPMLRHPLVYAIPFVHAFAWRSNDLYKSKLKALRDARLKKDWHSIVWLHERPYRRNAFWHIRKELHGSEYWDLLGSVWVDSENIFQWGHQRVRALLLSREPDNDHIMNEHERAALKNLPDELQVYRGYKSPKGTPRGWSWTLDEERARWFAVRLLDPITNKPKIVSGTVSKSDVTAYFTCRGEDEIVTQPRTIRNTFTSPVTGV